MLSSPRKTLLLLHPRAPCPARLAESLPPEVAVEAGHQHQLAVGVGSPDAELQQIAKELRLIDGEHLRRQSSIVDDALPC